MALVLENTLGDARIEVLTRLGFAEQGTAVLRNVNLVDSFIRKAARSLVHEADWAIMYRELEIPLIEGQDRYDFPDETETGQMDQIWCVDNNGKPWPMTSGIRWQDLEGDPADDTTFRVKTGQPERLRIINSEIQIYPAPTDTFSHIQVSYVKRMPKLLEDIEILPFDSELIIQQAVIYGKVHYGMPGVREDERDKTKYLMHVKKQQRVGRVFTAGGRKSHFVTRPKETRGFRFRGNDIGRNAAWNPNWNPWI